MSSSKLYVGNFTYDTTESTIEALFAPHGSVTSVALITDRDSGRSKGFGFVEMSSAEEAQAAKSALDGFDLGGRALKVDAAKEREPRTGGSRGGNGGGGYGGGGYGGGGNRW
ncbi:MAG: RNA recognition motif domain-containing protein [Thermoleophilia bacterium]